MWHSERGMSTIEIWEAEERQKRIWAYRRKKEYQKIVNALVNLLDKRTAVQQDSDDRERAMWHMIEEGGPIYEKEQGGNDD